MERATKKQLLQIALYEPCELDVKFAAVRELQERYLDEEVRADMLYRLGIGTSIEQVAKENGLTNLQVIDYLREIQRTGKRSDIWQKGYIRTLLASGRKIYASEKYFRDMKEEKF